MSKNYFINTSFTKSLSLRYGEGNRSLLQIRARGFEPVPSVITPSEGSKLVYAFEDLRIIEEKDLEAFKKETQEHEDSEVVSNETGEVENEETQGGDSGVDTDSSNNDDNDNGGSSEGEGNPDTDSEDGEGSDDSENTEDGETPEDGEGSDDSGETFKPFEKKELEKMTAEQVKEVAKALEIEVNDESTKKALIPVILTKQQEVMNK